MNGIQTANVASTYGVGTTTTRTTLDSGMNQDMFLQMLSAQLKYQDPMESVDSSQMVLQMAQFAQIEASNQLNQKISLFLEFNSIGVGSDMVGKTVQVATTDAEGNSTVKTGVVDRVGFTENGPILRVDGDYYEMWSVISIEGQPYEAPKQEGTK